MCYWIKFSLSAETFKNQVSIPKKHCLDSLNQDTWLQITVLQTKSSILKLMALLEIATLLVIFRFVVRWYIEEKLFR